MQSKLPYLRGPYRVKRSSGGFFKPGVVVGLATLLSAALSITALAAIIHGL